MSHRFYKPSEYNLETKQQFWCSVISDHHDTFCGCTEPYAHLLSILFPEGHQDLDKTIRQILDRDYKNRWPSSGEGETNTGGEPGTATGGAENHGQEEEEDLLGDADVEELIAAAQSAETR